MVQPEYLYSAAFFTLPGQPRATYNAQKPKVSLRWQPVDPKYIGAVTLRGSYTEAFHAPTLSELTPASTQNFPIVGDPFTAGNPPKPDRASDGGTHLRKPESCIRKWPTNGPTELFTAPSGLRV